MVVLGQAALFVSLVATLWAAAAGILGGALGSPGLVKSSGRGIVASFVLLALAMCGLAWALLTNDFNVVYVSDYSSLHQDLPYKVSALWAGQGGSLLFWAFVLSCFSAAAVWLCRRPQLEPLLPWAYATLATTTFFFAIVTAFVANPFERFPAGATPPDGVGLNPLLQNFWMMIHPPTLYLGYVGCSVPFAFALAALITGRLDNAWVRAMRRWTLFTYAFLTLGIWLGGYWAYIELGWGGFWAWDAVENASLMPWLVMTAFVHSLMIQDRRGMMKIWNMLLVAATFLLSIYGTFLTRSGIIQSVHAFSKSSIGNWFLGFMILAGAITLIALFRRLKELRPEAKIESTYSRESVFLFGNVVLVCLTVMVFFLTMLPVFSQLLIGRQKAAEPIDFTVRTRWLFLPLLLLMAVAPLAPWRRGQGSQFARAAAVPGAITLVLVGLLAAFGAREPWSVLFFAAAFFLGAVIVRELFRIARQRPESDAEAGRSPFLVHRRRIGALVSHFAVVLMVIGIVASMVYKSDEKFESLAPGQVVTIDGYKLSYVGFDIVDAPTFDGAIVKFAVEKPNAGGRSLLVLPEMRRYGKNRRPEERQPSTEVAILSTLLPNALGDVKRIGEDLYVIPMAVDLQGNRASVEVLVHPMVNWLWFGGVLLLFGTFVAYWPDRREPAAQRVNAPAGAPAPKPAAS